jgi:DnaK suppressor protein
MLDSHRGRLLGEIAERLRQSRDEARDLRASDVLDRVELFQEEDLDYALLGMKTETIQRIDAALRRLREEEYGLCSECRQEISDQRLSAMPFAIRCLGCEERAEGSARWRAPRRSRVMFDEGNV